MWWSEPYSGLHAAASWCSPVQHLSRPEHRAAVPQATLWQPLDHSRDQRAAAHSLVSDGAAGSGSVYVEHWSPRQLDPERPVVEQLDPEQLAQLTSEQLGGQRSEVWSPVQP